ncbi:hypothetical protein SASPL_142638 [Salvia splendens]|uniref:Pectinesterase inhibitor domain-containing protein n=1 Tax=Salvia splendens TaxID=180675 RepID=A0A8X8WKA0_SALSN|nr:hypothetical protein SASPL_142638 [Salvia splendens]
MTPRKLVCYNKILIAAAALLLVLGSQAEARKFVGVNPFCRTASYRRVCTQMVSGAVNQRDASVNAIKATIALADRLKSIVPTIEPGMAHLAPVSRDSIMKVCVSNFDNIVDNLGVGLRAVEEGDVSTATSYLSASTASDCVDAMLEFGIGADFPLSKYSAHLTHRVDNCLAVILQE